jgi:hypothetical protein
MYGDTQRHEMAQIAGQHRQLAGRPVAAIARSGNPGSGLCCERDRTEYRPCGRRSDEAEKVVRDIRQAARRQYSAEEKVRIVIAGLRGEDSIAGLCRKEGINQNLYAAPLEGKMEVRSRK